MNAISLRPGADALDRVYGFDLLRGFCALLVATFHILYWLKLAWIYSWAAYGVYIFFVLSGASMVVAYKRRFDGGLNPATFMWLRFMRLAPLCFLTMALMVLTNPMHVGYGGVAFLTATFLCALAPGYTSAVIGGWSIAVEVSYYLMFPVILAIVFSRYCWYFVATVVAGQMAFIHIILHKSTAMPPEYTQSLSFVAYFVVGCLIGRLILEGQIARRNMVIPFVVCVGLIMAGSGTSQVDTVLWVRGGLLFALSIAAVYFSATLDLPALGKRVASFFGDVSYGLYLLHPIVFFALKRITDAAVPLIGGTIIGTLVLAHLSYRLYESPLRERTKKRILPSGGPENGALQSKISGAEQGPSVRSSNA